MSVWIIERIIADEDGDVYTNVFAYSNKTSALKKYIRLIKGWIKEREEFSEEGSEDEGDVTQSREEIRNLKNNPFHLNRGKSYEFHASRRDIFIIYRKTLED